MGNHKDLSIPRSLTTAITSASLVLASLAVPVAQASPMSVTTSNTPAAIMLAAAKKKKNSKDDGKLTAKKVEAMRNEAREAAAAAEERGEWGEAADILEAKAKELGDPVTMIEAGRARLKQAEEAGSVSLARASVEMYGAALDILRFYDSLEPGEADSNAAVVAPGQVTGLIRTAEHELEGAEELVVELEPPKEELEAATDAPRKKERTKRDLAPGTAMLAVGAAFTAVGVVGLGMGFAGLGIGAAKDKEADKKKLPEQQAQVDKLDEEGRRANRTAIAGLVLAGGLLVGIPLVVLGARKRKKGTTPTAAKLSISPMVSGSNSGLVMTGRF